MRLIDADALIPSIQEERIEGKILDIIKALGDELQAETLNQACDRHIKIISSSPTINAVEVVRCVDCRWGRKACGNIECFVDINVPPEYHKYDWYCPNGERIGE